MHIGSAIAATMLCVTGCGTNVGGSGNSDRTTSTEAVAARPDKVEEAYDRCHRRFAEAVNYNRPEAEDAIATFFIIMETKREEGFTRAEMMHHANNICATDCRLANPHSVDNSTGCYGICFQCLAAILDAVY